MEDDINNAALKEALESGIDLRQYSAEVEQKLRKVSLRLCSTLCVSL